MGSSVTATAIGNGVYFATQASYSARSTYSPADVQGHRYMYLCRVLTGTYTQGQAELKEPPEKDPKKPGDRFDSVANDTSGNPDMFVIFNDVQAYPEYLLTFK